MQHSNKWINLVISKLLVITDAGLVDLHVTGEKQTTTTSTSFSGLPSWQRDWTGLIMLIVLFLVSHFNFLFVPCGGLSWLPVSFLLHTISYRIVRWQSFQFRFNSSVEIVCISRILAGNVCNQTILAEFFLVYAIIWLIRISSEFFSSHPYFFRLHIVVIHNNNRLRKRDIT